jgi:hypothetical protein
MIQDVSRTIFYYAENFDTSLKAGPSRRRGRKTLLDQKIEVGTPTTESLCCMIPILILVILEGKSQDGYSQVKKWEDCGVGVSTLCVKKKQSGANIAVTKLILI